MNIYEQLNKINDTESLSEKYNVKNAKELKKLQESSSVKLRAGRQQKLEAFMNYINDKAIELGFDINPATEAHVLTNQRRNVYLNWNYFVGNPPIVLSVNLSKNGGYIVTAALGENWIYPLPSYDFEPSEKSEQEVYQIIDELLYSQHNVQNLEESVNTTKNYSEIREYLRQGKIVDVTDYEGEYSDIIYALCADVEEQLMDKYKHLFIEPSVQAGRGGIFAWFTRDGKQYEAKWDYEEECEEINNFVIANASEEEFKRAYSAYVEDKLNHAVLKENMSRKLKKNP